MTTHPFRLTIAAALATVVLLGILVGCATSVKKHPTGPSFVLDTQSLRINDVPISRRPDKAELVGALGEPSSIESKKLGVIYVYDHLGLTFRKNVEDDRITEMSLYWSDRSETGSSSPTQPFTGSITLNGKGIPKSLQIHDLISEFPEFSEEVVGLLYSAEWAGRKVEVYTEDDMVRTIGIVTIAQD